MRWKLLFTSLALLGILHFVASPLMTRAFNEVAARFFQPALRAEKISLDLINAQASFRNLRLAMEQDALAPIVDLRNIILHWSFLPLLSKQIVLEEICIAGATVTIPLEEGAAEFLNAIRIKLPWENGPDRPLLAKGTNWFHAFDTDPSKEVRAPVPRYRIEGTVVHYPSKKSPLIVRNVYLSDVTLRAARLRTDRPALPALTNLSLSVRNLASCFQPFNAPAAFSLQTKLAGQEASYVKAEGQLTHTGEGLSGSCEIRMEGLDIAQLWPWINPEWLPEDFSPFQVTEGTMDFSSRVHIASGRWTFDNHVTLKKLKVRVDSNSPYRKIKGASPELVMQAINTLGEAEMQFSDYRQWRNAFEENVMKGVRNLIRQSIGNALAGR